MLHTTPKLHAGEFVLVAGQAYEVEKVVGSAYAQLKIVGGSKRLNVSVHSQVERLEGKIMAKKNNQAKKSNRGRRNGLVFDKYSTCAIYRYIGENSDATPREAHRMMADLGIDTLFNTAVHQVGAGSGRGPLAEPTKADATKLDKLLKKARLDLVEKPPVKKMTAASHKEVKSTAAKVLPKKATKKAAKKPAAKKAAKAKPAARKPITKADQLGKSKSGRTAPKPKATKKATRK